MTARPWQAAAVAVLSAVVVVAVASRSGQSFYSDPALEMKTALQFVAGESPRPNTWVRPDHADLARSTEENLIVWAPGSAIAFVPLVRAGLTPARAARAIAAVALLAGSAGWLVWFASFSLPRPIVFAYARVLPWMRFASASGSSPRGGCTSMCCCRRASNRTARVPRSARPSRRRRRGYGVKSPMPNMSRGRHCSSLLVANDARSVLVDDAVQGGPEHRLRAAGFTTIARAGFGQSRLPALAQDREHRAPYSLSLEALETA